MNKREVRFYRDPNKSNMSSQSRLELELLDIAHANISEAGVIGGPTTIFASMFEELVTNDPLLTWRGRGPGIGRELRRSYSNIHGRILARTYLEKFEGVEGLMPIDGNGFVFEQNSIVCLRDGEKGDMPDWVGWDPKGYVIAEAKGTYDGRNWERAFWGGYALPQCLQKAQEQVNRVQINEVGNARRYDIEYKGWAVASRWATEENGLSPWLAALDPIRGAVQVGLERFRSSAANMQREILGRMVSTFGFDDGMPMISSKDGQARRVWDYQYQRELLRKVMCSDEREVRGLSAAYVRGTFSQSKILRKFPFLRKYSLTRNIFGCDYFGEPFERGRKKGVITRGEDEEERSNGFSKPKRVGYCRSKDVAWCSSDLN